MKSKNLFRGYQFHQDIILQAVYWYCRYSLSYWDIEELMEERGVKVDHSTVQRWAETFLPLVEDRAKRRQNRVNGS